MSTPPSRLPYSAQPGQQPVCRFCGSVPAVRATVRGHRGLVVIMRFLTLEGPFCRDCGIAVHRDMTAKSLWQGWWGIASAIVNPATMLINLLNRAKINKLAPPVPGAPGRPMDPGRPLFKRPEILGLLVPVAVALALVLSGSEGPESADVGDCVHNRHVTTADHDVHPDVVVVPCSGKDAEARIVGKVTDADSARTACRAFPDADGYYTRREGSDRLALCLHSLVP
ncbi:LppU/SCO3897 family protein [Kitasatospora sp. KL5]|uniref:LppU/SCO3897 family protein n=1 Tax=Kitasatospora sp. KL5 TaxID=3425125 RepID=UPI003D6F5C0F